jgi:class 3 adenylate cyclase/tetratricopeptide (TPR) repeat protein
MCGARLHEAPAPREERKVVTVLFCDLVGSTAEAERMDPEDVRARLSRYHERVRTDLERFGGTVEKFIGDAVMALFGAPSAHEDDPERAVRAALAIREWTQEEGELQVRIGITTGEALVALSADPRAGEGMASGDVVNTAARIQSAAPADGILADETTYRATARAIEYGEQRAVSAKGKARAVPVREVLHARARVHVERGGRAPLVGREKELEVLLAALRRVREEREPQLLTLVGVPGIGKSRLVYELFKAIEVGGELTFWRQGRSLPYGDGVSYWALGEMVKAQAGVLETDDTGGTAEKLREAVATLIPDAADAQWVGRHLGPLVGLEADEELGSDRRNEAFAAWRRFLEALAEQRPLVLVFEDLHFADDGLLDFVDYLADWASGVAILVIGTARPELLARRPGWGGGKANAVTLSLAALSDDETARLVHSLLERPLLSAELQQTLLARAGGNPLYAEEFARMLEEREPAAGLRLPETVQALIAARIDALPVEEKALLQDVSVLGKLFWLGAAAALSQVERRAAEERLHALERKEFIRRERRSTVAGETEYAFRHLLVRDVAYGQIPRAARADTHRRAAVWIQSLGRPDDHAEMVAHHYLSALELSRAAARPTGDIADAARVALREAGDRSFSLNAFPSAARYYGAAVDLWPDGDPERAELLFSLARARHRAGDELAEQTLEEAREALLAKGRRERAAEAEALLAELWWHRANRERCDAHLDRANELVRDLSASPGKAHVLSQIARYRMLARDYESAVAIGTEALAMAELLGLDELQAHALNNVASAKSLLGDTTAVADLERSVELAQALRSPEAARALNNLGSALVTHGDLRRAAHYFEEAARVGEELGAPLITRFSRANCISCLQRSGEWDEALRHLNEHIAAFGGTSDGCRRDGVSGTREDALRARRYRGRARRHAPRAAAGAGSKGPADSCPRAWGRCACFRRGRTH